MDAAIVSHGVGSVGTVLGKLGALLAQESKKLWGVRDEVQDLKDELESMNSFLENLARKEDHDKQVKIWMKQVREMAYDTEDCIDEFMHHIGGPIEGGWFLRQLRRGVRLLRTLKARSEIASKIQSLKTCVHSVSERRSRYAHVDPIIESSGSIGSSMDPRLHTLFPKGDEVVGIEDRTDKVVSLLIDNNVPGLRVISIVGYGGLGKTTLAMTAYDDPAVKSGHFQCRAQISMSQMFNFNVLLRDILKQLFPPPPPPPQGQMAGEGENNSRNSNPLENIENWDERELVKKLKDHLEDKRYVIVVDDIWTKSAWDSIKFIFPDKNNGSRIIVTTRIKSVAESCSFPHHDYVYEIEPLGKIQSTKLFLNKVFGPSNICPPELKVVSDNILEKCRGMPLAIVSIAGLLSMKPNKTTHEWKKVNESLGSELETNPSLEGMRKILNLSYNDLPYHLKTCFLYMSIFPEDYKIRREKLVRRWVAEGFVSGKRGLISEEEVAEDYFDEFVNRNLIQAVDFSINGRVKTCRVHDMILELIVSKSVENNFVSIIGDHYTLVPRDKFRRLSVQSSEQKFMKFGLSHVRSLSLFYQLCKPISFSNFRAIRVLDLEYCGISDNHLSNVGKLFLLKYLGLRGNWGLKKLPRKIYKLQHLEMLDIKGTNIGKLPKEASNLRNLKHLVASPYQHFWLNLENMRNLETLTRVEFGKKTPKSLENLKHLTKLGFKIDSDRNKELGNLQLSPNLYSLKIECIGGLVPNRIDSLHYLVKLTLWGLTLTDSDMQKLGTLPKLFSLKLHVLIVVSNQENKLFFRKDLFKCMKLLAIARTDVRVIFEEAAAPNLEKLTLVHYGVRDGHEMGPIIGMEHLLKLKEIRITYRGPRPSTSINEMEEAAHAHPNDPNIIIEDHVANM